MTSNNPYDAMQAAVDIIPTSLHPANKVAATVFGPDFMMSHTNFWPEPILAAFGMEGDIGNSSGTVHAETACLLKCGHATDGASLCVTDPFCPNCAKNIVEAGIKNIYIDHKGFQKDFFQRRSGHFEEMSMQICEKAGISVYEVWRKDRRLIPILEAKPGKVVPEDSPVYKEEIDAISEDVFLGILTQAYQKHKERKFAAALVKDGSEKAFALTARGHVVTGFSMEDPDDIKFIGKHADKYNFFQEPVNRLLMYMTRFGLTLCADYLFSSQVPTSREQVNLVGAGAGRIVVGDIQKSRDTHAQDAMEQLSGAEIVRYV